MFKIQAHCTASTEKRDTTIKAKRRKKLVSEIPSRLQDVTSILFDAAYTAWTFKNVKRKLPFLAV